MSSIFTKIIQGEIPSYKVAEDDHHLAILDIMPIKRGHVLVIPKKEIEKIFDLMPLEFMSLMHFSYQVAKVLEKVIPSKRLGLGVVGFEVSHAHIHLIPIDKESDFNFLIKKKKYISTQDLQDLAFTIQNAYQSMTESS